MKKIIELNKEEIKDLILSSWANDKIEDFGFCVDFGTRTKEFFILNNPEVRGLKLNKIVFEFEELNQEEELKWK